MYPSFSENVLIMKDWYKPQTHSPHNKVHATYGNSIDNNIQNLETWFIL